MIEQYAKEVLKEYRYNRKVMKYSPGRARISAYMKVMPYNQHFRIAIERYNNYWHYSGSKTLPNK